MAKKGWGAFTPLQKAAMVFAVAAQLSLLGAALADIRRRPQEELRGSKRAWAALAFVNYVGPISYFLFGRRR